MPTDDPMALNEAVANIRRLIELQRQFSAPPSPTGQTAAMDPLYGYGLPPMIQSVAQPDR
jgi:hypothetical protein